MSFGETPKGTRETRVLPTEKETISFGAMPKGPRTTRVTANKKQNNNRLANNED
jgi:hypothetical protein